ncbi:MAG TPA: 50S ribosomal protein L11 methyltransferase [Clostridia bacterium]|nr:50S ribosomal protein L11 methyltransferase [Clostridia bacterium]
MEWKEISLTTSHEASEAGANIFFEIGAQGVVIEDPYVLDRYMQEDAWDCFDISLCSISEDVVIIKGYLPADSSFPGRLSSFNEKVNSLQEFFPDSPLEVAVCEVADENWASSWKQYYKTTKIGRRVVVKPEWEEYSPSQGEIIIEMNPGSAFGTGTHATTIMCVRLLEKYLGTGQIVFDVGCGSGILSIAAAKLGASFILARDIDTAAVSAAWHNAGINGITGCFEAEAGNFLDGVPGKAHLIVANIVSGAIIEFSPQAFEKLLPEGILIVSGIISERAKEVQEKMESTGFSLLETVTRGEWVAIAAKKLSAPNKAVFKG